MIDKVLSGLLLQQTITHALDMYAISAHSHTHSYLYIHIRGNDTDQLSESNMSLI